MIDLMDYLRGDGRLYELVNNLGTYEIVQTQSDPNNVFYHVKNSQWEELWADDVFIYRGTDTSPGNGELYMLSEANHYGSAWVPRWYDLGQTYQRSATVIWRRKDNGAAVPSKPTGVAVTYLRLERIYTQLTFQSGIQLADVVELHSYLDDGGKPASAPWEKYFYAKGFGLVSFQDMLGGFHSWIAQKFTPETMPQRVREVIPWLVPLQRRFYLPAAPATTAAGQAVVSQIPSDFVNVRAYPNSNAKDIGDLLKNATVTVYTPDFNGWVFVNTGTVQGWVSRQSGKVVFTPSNSQPPPPPPPPQVSLLGNFTLTEMPSNWVNVYDYPNDSANDIGDLHKNDTVKLYMPEVNGYVYIEMGGLHGWVGLQAGKVGFTEVPAPPPIPPDGLPPLPTLSPVGLFNLTTVPSQWVNVRAYPDSDKGAVVNALHQGDLVTLYTPEVNGWVFTQSDDHLTGWVSRQDGKVAFTAFTGPAPIPHDDLPPLPKLTPVGQYKLSQLPGTWINIRAYPKADGTDIGDLHQGDVLTLYTPEVDGWVFVTSNAVRGWVARQDGKVAFTPIQATESAQAAMPIYGDASAASIPHDGAVYAAYAAPLTPTNGNGSKAPAITASNGNGNTSNAIVALDNSLVGTSLPNSKEDVVRLRDAFQQVEDGARRVRSELERLIGRMRD